MKRNATAVWHGSGKEGNGVLSTQSNVLNDTQYSFKTRFEDGIGTNPEELIAAAHAGCFTMQLTFNIDGAGFKAEEIASQCAITFENGTISHSHLMVRARVPGISQEKFDELVAHAEKNCPVSRVLNAGISVEATLSH